VRTRSQIIGWAALSIFGFALVACRGCEKKPAAVDGGAPARAKANVEAPDAALRRVLARIPKRVDGVVAIGKTGVLAGRVAAFEERMRSDLLIGSALSLALHEAKRSLGFNPFSLGELRGNGFDPEGAMALATLPDGSLLAVASVAGDFDARAREIAARLMSVERWETRATPLGPIVTAHAAGDRVKGNQSFSYAVRDGLVLLATHRAGEALALRLIEEARGLAADASFGETAWPKVAKQLRAQDGVTIWGSPRGASRALRRAGLDFIVEPPVEAWSLSVALLESGFAIDAFLPTRVEATARLREAMMASHDAAFAGAVDGDALFVLKGVLRPEPFFKAVIGETPMFKDEIAVAEKRVKSQLGVDPKALIESLTGHFALVVDGVSDSITRSIGLFRQRWAEALGAVRASVWVETKNPALAEKALKAAARGGVVDLGSGLKARAAVKTFGAKGAVVFSLGPGPAAASANRRAHPVAADLAARDKTTLYIDVANVRAFLAHIEEVFLKNFQPAQSVVAKKLHDLLSHFEKGHGFGRMVDDGFKAHLDLPFRAVASGNAGSR
jgi:hypothetical protein